MLFWEEQNVTILRKTWISQLDLYFIDEYSWKDINYPSRKDDWKKVIDVY